MSITTASNDMTDPVEIDFKLDLSKGVKRGEVRQPNKFNHLCDNIDSCSNAHISCLSELYKLKDELLKHSLPSNLLLQVILLSSKIYRSSADLNTLTNELVRLMRQYSVPWEEKGTVLKRLRTDYENKQRQLSVAVKHLQLIAVKADRMEHERRLNNWMKLYAKVMSAKCTGRRWKFRVAPFKTKIANGYNPYGSDSDESQSDEDEFFDHHTTSSGSEEELRELASELSQALASQQNTNALKGIQFAGLEEAPLSVAASSMSPDVPAVSRADAMTWTGEPAYDNYLLVSLYRPRDVLKEVDICCSVTLGDDFFASKVYKPNEESYQSFHFSLEDEIASFLPPLVKPNSQEFILGVPKLSIAVFPHNLANDMIGMCSIPLPSITLKEEHKVIVPPNSSDEGSNEWALDWEALCDNGSAESIKYPFKLVNESKGVGEPHLLLDCQLIRVQRHKSFDVATVTQEWDELVQVLGYRKECDTVSKAVSAMTLVESNPTSPGGKPLTPEETLQDRVNTEEIGQLTLRHAEELRLLQEQYEKKLKQVSCDLSKMALEKQKQIDALEKALIQQSETSQTKRFRSPSEIKKLMASKKPRRSTKMDWGKQWPDDFYERMSLFNHDSLQRQAELTERIKQEVHETCERQLAALHRLAPLVTSTTSALNDVCLPALFMPLPSSRPLVFNPRAHNYFHPPGSIESRVSQPPSIFKLPPLCGQQSRGLTTINLGNTGCYWQQTSPSPHLTPAPPPSACDNYPDSIAPATNGWS